jgi:hypothetical protein
MRSLIAINGHFKQKERVKRERERGAIIHAIYQAAAAQNSCENFKANEARPLVAFA